MRTSDMCIFVASKWKVNFLIEEITLNQIKMKNKENKFLKLFSAQTLALQGQSHLKTV